MLDIGGEVGEIKELEEGRVLATAWDDDDDDDGGKIVIVIVIIICYLL